MDNNRFINLSTFEISDNIPGYIMTDKKIAKTIALLNKKGYKTLASCSGHYYQCTRRLQKNITLDLLEETKDETMFLVDEIRTDGFDCWIEDQITRIYIMFDKTYKFSNLPENFIQEDEKTIGCVIHLLKDGKRKRDEAILNEIDRYNKILEEWAMKLPDIN